MIYCWGFVHVEKSELLTRDSFRESVFDRDGHKCVVCGAPAQDAHHIMERRLWVDGGYFLGNGASLCGSCHYAAEETMISCDAIRAAAGIERVWLPPHLYRDQPYDKWGNPILPNGTRLRGELFHDPSVQKVLAPVLNVFTTWVKYPRTYHLPWSPGVGKDDRVMGSSFDAHAGLVVVTLKMDGENTSMYRDHIHARSLTYEPHPSRSLVKALHAQIAYDIPPGWRLCGENVTAKHSIGYEDLPGPFMLFSVWDDRNVCLPWDETLEWAQLLDLPVVEPFFTGVFDQREIHSRFLARFVDKHEGYVVRQDGPIPYSDFRNRVGKWVRPNHVQTHGHWMRQQVEFNGMEEK